MNNYETTDPEEIRYIYKLVLEGYSDSDILEEYGSLKGKGQLKFPLRTDERLIHDRRVEMEIAADVLKESVQKIIKIYTPNNHNNIDEHLSRIDRISEILLQDNLSTIVENLPDVSYGIKSKHSYSPGYTVKNSRNITIHLSELDLLGVLSTNIENACKQHGYSFFYDCYVSHIKSVMDGKMEAMGGFWPALEKQPYQVIMKIKGILNDKDEKGSCAICRNELRLAPFIMAHYRDILPDSSNSSQKVSAGLQSS